MVVGSRSATPFVAPEFFGVLNMRTTDEMIAQILSYLEDLDRRLTGEASFQKDWYSTAEVAGLLKVSEYTVRQRWCNGGRIDCEKDPFTGRWRVHRREVERLINLGGSAA